MAESIIGGVWCVVTELEVVSYVSMFNSHKRELTCAI